MMNSAPRSEYTFFGSTSTSGGNNSPGWTAATQEPSANRTVSHDATSLHHPAVTPSQGSDRLSRQGAFLDVLQRFRPPVAISLDSQANELRLNAPRGNVIPNPSHPPDARTANLSQNGLAGFADEEAHPVNGPVGAQISRVDWKYRDCGECSSRDRDLEAVNPSQASSSQFGGSPMMNRLGGQLHPQGPVANQACSSMHFPRNSKVVHESTHSDFRKLLRSRQAELDKLEESLQSVWDDDDDALTALASDEEQASLKNLSSRSMDFIEDGVPPSGVNVESVSVVEN